MVRQARRANLGLSGRWGKQALRVRKGPRVSKGRPER